MPTNEMVFFRKIICFSLRTKSDALLKNYGILKQYLLLRTFTTFFSVPNPRYLFY